MLKQHIFIKLNYIFLLVTMLVEWFANILNALCALKAVLSATSLPWRTTVQNLSFTFFPQTKETSLNGCKLDLSHSDGRTEIENKVLRWISGPTGEQRKLHNSHSSLSIIRIG
jgi:hypothetical protein